VGLPLAAACALQRYDAQPVDVARGEREFLARTPQDAGVRAFFAANGADVGVWPPARWSMRELTLLAFYYHPDLEVARAYWDAIRAGAQAAPAGGVSAIKPALEHHSRRSDNGERVSPWTLSIAFDYAFTGQRKRQAQLAYAQAQARAAQWEVAKSAWQVRSGLRERALQYHAARQRIEAWQSESELRIAVQQMMEKRLTAGAASQLDMSNVRTAASEAAARLAQARSEAAAAHVALAQALGIGATALERLTLDFQLFSALPKPEQMPAAALQRAALWHRGDIQQALSSYESEDKLLQVELSKQYPDFAITPGFSWDQEDNVWQLGWNVGLPLPKSNTTAIAQARAQRALQGQRVRALQAKVIGELEQAQVNYQGARDALVRTAQLIDEQRAQWQRVEKQMNAGYADRLDTTLARLELAGAQRQRVEALIIAQRALGALEDAMQRPLFGAALPHNVPGVPSNSAARQTER
jgi:outer membrane protein TolC